MKAYIGSKIILAEPMSADEFERNTGKRAGGKGDGYKVVYSGGYTSWSPKDVFEEAYRLVNEDEALIAARVIQDEHGSERGR